MRSGENATKFGASDDPCKRAPTLSQTAVAALRKLSHEQQTIFKMDVDEDDDFYGSGDGVKPDQEHDSGRAPQSDVKAEDDDLEEGEEEDEEGEDDDSVRFELGRLSRYC